MARPTQTEKEEFEATTATCRAGDPIREDKLLWVYCRDHERDVNPATVQSAARNSRADVGST